MSAHVCKTGLRGGIECSCTSYTSSMHGEVIKLVFTLAPSITKLGDKD